MQLPLQLERLNSHVGLSMPNAKQCLWPAALNKKLASSCLACWTIGIAPGLDSPRAELATSVPQVDKPRFAVNDMASTRAKALSSLASKRAQTPLSVLMLPVTLNTAGKLLRTRRVVRWRSTS